jgi:transcriptional regulator with PAS, ATPase and Fis domain
VRIIAATNLDLKKAIEKGEFREDLFYRLNSVAIHLPPLRERPEDIVPLTTQFISTYCKKQKKPQKELSPKVIEILMSYAWPGNVRELENVIENVVTFSEREIIRPKDLPPEIASEESAGKHCQVSSLEIAEEEHIRKAVTLAAGNKKLASRMLKIPRATLYRKMQKYGID